MLRKNKQKTVECNFLVNGAVKMSFKDVRDLSEHLKLLGYPRNFPLQCLYNNYGSLASFKVVADILQWLAGRLEPGTVLPGGTGSESDRVLLIRAATEFFVTKCGIKLNPRKLYASSSATAKELQKISGLLIATPAEEDDAEEDSFKSIAQVDLGDKVDELRRARELSSELTNRGAVLHDLLTKELINKENRLAQSSRAMELATIERSLRNAFSSLQIKLQAARNQLEVLRVERNAVHSKLQRKKAELERTKQRLEALSKIRPAFIEEFEQLENELRGHFQDYFVRIQCRDALKAQLAARIKNPTPIATPVVKPAENSMNFIPEGLIDDDDDDEDEDVDNDDEDKIPGLKEEGFLDGDKKVGQAKDSTRVRPTTGRYKPRTGTTIGRQKIIGSMLGDNEEDALDSTLGSEESESELDLGGAEYDLNSDDDISLSKLTGDVPSKPGNKHDHSDEDF